ncbi:hypothetical protein D9M68_894910 [compost metagenome]
MVDRGEGALGHQYGQAEVTQHAKRLRGGDLVNKVTVNEKLGLTVSQDACGMALPNLVKQASS